MGSIGVGSRLKGRQNTVESAVPERISSGIAGLDEILQGGYIAGRTYLLSGPPGGGKTTIGWHFLLGGAPGAKTLFITFGESRSELLENASYSGFDPEHVEFCDLSAPAELFEDVRSYDIFPASEVELEPMTARLVEAVRSAKPERIFIDSMTALRYLYKDNTDFRRQTHAFLRYVKQHGGIVLMTSEASPEAPDDDLRFLSDGVIELAPSERARSLEVVKFRGSDYRVGKHTLRLGDHGATVYPRLMPEQHGTTFAPTMLSSGIDTLDAMMGGGIERGTVTLLTGPSGIGKTTIGAQFMKAAAERGERSAIYSFDERLSTLVSRCESVSIPVTRMMDAGMLSITPVEALRFSADEFANMVRRDVEERGTRIVMIDSISGYRLSVSDQSLNERLHALCRYLTNVGVTVLLINELMNIADFHITDVGITYLADNVIMLRYIESRSDGGPAQLGRIIAVLKKRLSDFEKNMRAFEVTSRGIVIGEPVDHLGGILGRAHDTAIAH
jgi:circadian clock protein KaiC